MSETNWTIDSAHSAINFSVRHMMFTKVNGRFTSWKGRLEFKEETLEDSTVEISIDAASIDTGEADRDNHLRSADFLDVEQYPELTFRATQIKKLAGNQYQVTGDLTLRDVTRPMVLDVEYGGMGKDPWGQQRAGLMVKGTLNRKEFGLNWNQVLEMGGVLVGENVGISIELQLIKQGDQQAA